MVCPGLKRVPRLGTFCFETNTVPGKAGEVDYPGVYMCVLVNSVRMFCIRKVPKEIGKVTWNFLKVFNR